MQAQPPAAAAAKRELLREAIFENLGAVRLFVETAQQLIEAGDDTGMRHPIRMGALHFKAAIDSSNDLARLKAARAGASEGGSP